MAAISISASVLEPYISAIFQALSCTPDDAAAVTRHLIKADLRGRKTHGTSRVPRYADGIGRGQIKPSGKVTFKRPVDSILIADGGLNLGQVVMSHVLSRACPIARATGLLALTVKNSNHIGEVGQYCESAAEKGFFAYAIVNTNANPRVAPFNGRERIFGTNPIACAAPTLAQPLVIDTATSTAVEGLMSILFRVGREAAPNCLMDVDGNDTCDPTVLYEGPPGSLLPLGGRQAGHKGTSLALMADMFAILAGSGTSFHHEGTSHNGVFMLLLDITRFMPLEEFSKELQLHIDRIRGSKPVPGVDRVLCPGDPERLCEVKYERDGIPMEEKIWAEIAAIASAHGVPVPELG